MDCQIFVITSHCTFRAIPQMENTALQAMALIQLVCRANQSSQATHKLYLKKITVYLRRSRNLGNLTNIFWNPDHGFDLFCRRVQSEMGSDSRWEKDGFVSFSFKKWKTTTRMDHGPQQRKFLATQQLQSHLFQTLHKWWVDEMKVKMHVKWVHLFPPKKLLLRLKWYSLCLTWIMRNDANACVTLGIQR